MEKLPYISPKTDVICLETDHIMLVSNFENPIEGEEWIWDLSFDD